MALAKPHFHKVVMVIFLYISLKSRNFEHSRKEKSEIIWINQLNTLSGFRHFLK